MWEILQLKMGSSIIPQFNSFRKWFLLNSFTIWIVNLVVSFLSLYTYVDAEVGGFMEKYFIFSIGTWLIFVLFPMMIFLIPLRILQTNFYGDSEFFKKFQKSFSILKLVLVAVISWKMIRIWSDILA